MHFVIRDRDAKFCRGFDDVFGSEGAEVLRTPLQAPNANAYAERWIGTVRAECLDWLLVVGRGHLERTLKVYIAHYNAHRPHRALQLEPPDPAATVTLISGQPGYTDATCSAVSCTSTDELHERISVPHGSGTAPRTGVPAVASAGSADQPTHHDERQGKQQPEATTTRRRSVRQPS